ncbi:hypothetical protein SKAU_G00242010 [Synaphobranchus kaupii]|uniref:Uncharacterized protein n=1 Tax=Synaphobranchus kaupii TaxID=118154 RepID=A0A9Q1F7Z2_SYNKA|nr:hypothetical protein SKAU_G00242010 [Synaphobranchus kaupii]
MEASSLVASRGHPHLCDIIKVTFGYSIEVPEDAPGIAVSFRAPVRDRNRLFRPSQPPPHNRDVTTMRKQGGCGWGGSCVSRGAEQIAQQGEEGGGEREALRRVLSICSSDFSMRDLSVPQDDKEKTRRIEISWETGAFRALSPPGGAHDILLFVTGGRTALPAYALPVISVTCHLRGRECAAKYKPSQSALRASPSLIPGRHTQRGALTLPQIYPLLSHTARAFHVSVHLSPLPPGWNRKNATTDGHSIMRPKSTDFSSGTWVSLREISPDFELVHCGACASLHHASQTLTEATVKRLANSAHGSPVIGLTPSDTTQLSRHRREAGRRAGPIGTCNRAVKLNTLHKEPMTRLTAAISRRALVYYRSPTQKERLKRTKRRGAAVLLRQPPDTTHNGAARGVHNDGNSPPVRHDTSITAAARLAAVPVPILKLFTRREFIIVTVNDRLDTSAQPFKLGGQKKTTEKKKVPAHLRVASIIASKRGERKLTRPPVKTRHEPSFIFTGKKKSSFQFMMTI